MDNELEQQAIQTFAAVPEIYQQAFKEAGADFPDELVSAIKSDPNKAVELVNTNKNLKQAVIGIFQQNKDAIMQYMQKQTSMFKEGGKFDYLDKLQKGGNLSRREALNYAQQNKGYTAEQARRAYLSAKNALRSQGLRGKELRQAARNDIAWTQPQEVNNQISESTPEITLQEKTFTPISNLEIKSNVPTTTKVVRPISRPKRKDTEVPVVTQALMTEPPRTTVVVSEPENTNIDNLNTIGVKVIEPSTVVSNMPTNNVGVLRRLAQLAKSRWQANLAATRKAPDYNEQLRARRRAAYPMQAQFWDNRISYKQGGKVEKENEINKKYIKDSEKAGEKASKKMTDLKKRHKAELKKIK